MLIQAFVFLDPKLRLQNFVILSMSVAVRPLPNIELYAFWDIDKNKLDFIQDKNFIIPRMFERGKLDDILKIVSFYGLKECKKVLIHNKHLSREGIHLAHVLLGIPLERFIAYATLKHN